MSLPLSIGTVAKRAGVTVDTVRFYERRGILPAPERRSSGYRIYAANVVDRIRLVKDLQSLGLPLDEIVELLRMFDEGTATCENQQPRFEAVLARIDEELASLQATRNHIAQVLKRCKTGTCSLLVCAPEREAVVAGKDER